MEKNGVSGKKWCTGDTSITPFPAPYPVLGLAGIRGKPSAVGTAGRRNGGASCDFGSMWGWTAFQPCETGVGRAAESPNEEIAGCRVARNGSKGVR
jgi:hypothetical protein